MATLVMSLSNLDKFVGDARMTHAIESLGSILGRHGELFKENDSNPLSSIELMLRDSVGGNNEALSLTSSKS
jgi:hypothetical protein